MPASKHERALGLLGFKPMTSASLEMKPEITPIFSATVLFTFATDETGRTWSAVGYHDLSALGFKNTSAPEEVQVALGVPRVH